MCGKMAEELLSLKWNNHQAHFVDILTFLREQEIFVDATLACGGKLYAAHKFVLSTCSDYFKQMFTRSPSKHPIVYMKDVTARDLEALLDFMYNGEVNVPQSSLGSLIKTAEGLQIKGLAVPDDPPAPKRERDREKERDHKVHLEHSPPAKRLRPRERSPPHSTAPSLPQTPSVPRSRSPPHPPTPSGASQVGMPPVEATLDEDSRTSVHSANSNLSEVNSAPSLSSKQPASSSGDTTPHQDQLPSNPAEEPSPGPSGIQNPPQSKQEPEVDIKQEDVVDLGEEDEGDWNLEGDGGGGDSSLGGSENPNFPEVMLPHTTDGSVPTSGGDPAMGAMVQAKDILSLRPMQDIMGRVPEGSLSLRMRPLLSAVDEGSWWGGILEGNSVSKDLYRRHLWTNNNNSSGSGSGSGGIGNSSSSSSSSSRIARDHSDPESRPFPCPYCPFSFKRRYTLQEHVRIHIGFRPYACRSCGKTFTQRSSLLKHVRVRVCQRQAAQVNGYELK